MTSLKRLRVEMDRYFHEHLPIRVELAEAELDPAVMDEAAKVIDTLFRENPRRLRKEFAPRRKWNEAELAQSLGRHLTGLMTDSARLEGRRKVTRGDLYLSMLDMRRTGFWPWREGNTPDD